MNDQKYTYIQYHDPYCRESHLEHELHIARAELDYVAKKLNELSTSMAIIYDTVAAGGTVHIGSETGEIIEIGQVHPTMDDVVEEI